MSKVTVATIIEDLENLKDAVKAEKSITLEARIKLFTAITDRQLRAAALDLSYRKSAARLPDSGLGLTHMLVGDAPADTTKPAVQ